MVLVQTLVQWPVDPNFKLTSGFGANTSPVASGPKIPPSPLVTHLWSMEYAPVVNGMILEYTLTPCFSFCINLGADLRRNRKGKPLHYEECQM